MIPVQVDASLSEQSELTVTIEPSWLVCKDICIPGEGSASLTLPVVDSPSKATDARAASLFERTRKATPEKLDVAQSDAVNAAWDSANLTLSAPGATELTFYPYENTEGVYPPEIKDESHAKSDALTLRYKPDQIGLIKTVAGVLVVERDGEETRHEIAIPVG
jgi:DsbC/DsbD-like thiol-disulfide interchange protein